MTDLFRWIWQQPLTAAVFEIVIVLIIAGIAHIGLRIVLHRFRAYLIFNAVGNKLTKESRADTITGVIRNALTSVIWLVTVLMVLDTIGISIAPLIASAGVLGLAISFGAQELIRDGFTGFFFLLENQFNVGSQLEIANFKGTVIKMDLRTVTLRNEETKAIYIFRNSQIGVVSKFDPETESFEPVKKKSKAVKHG